MAQPIINWQYKNFLPIAMELINEVNNFPRGKLWIAYEDMITIDQPLTIQYQNNEFPLIITSIKRYNYCLLQNLDPKKYYIYELTVEHPMVRMEYNQYCKCWHNLSIKYIVTQLMVNYNLTFKNNIVDNTPKAITLQYNETHGNFFQRILHSINYFFYWNNDGINITNNWPLGNNLNQGIGYVYESIIPSMINNYKYDYKSMDKAYDFTVDSINNYQNQYEVFNHNHYKNYNKDYSCHMMTDAVNIGDRYNNEPIIYIKYRYLWDNYDPFMKNIVNIFNQHLPGIPNDLLVYGLIKTMGPNQSIPYNYITPSIQYLTGFVKSINGIHSNSYGDVLVEFPWKNQNSGINNLSNGAWVRCCQSIGQNNRGTWVIPQPNDEVVVGFLNNNLDEMVIVGTLYNQLAMPWQKDPQLIYLKSQNNSIVINEKENTMVIDNTSHIHINIKNGNHNLTIEEGQWNVDLKNGPLNYNINGDVTWNVTGNTQWNVDKDFNINSQNFNLNTTQWVNKITGLDIQSTGINIDTTQWDLKSSMINLEGSITNIKGEILDINGSGLINFNGNIILMNGDGMVNITGGFFNVTSSSSVVIRGSSPGSMGSFPPYYP